MKHPLVFYTYAFYSRLVRERALITDTGIEVALADATEGEIERFSQKNKKALTRHSFA